MKIRNYDCGGAENNYKQLYDYMPRVNFRMLFCGPSGCGKTNTLMHMIYNSLYYDKIYLYAKNLELSKYQKLTDNFEDTRDECGYDVITPSNDEIVPVSESNDENQKLLIFDDYICEKNQKPLIEYFIRGGHKNCSVIYLCQSYYKTLKDTRLNC